MGSIDLQVNGYGGTDFNRDGLTADALHTACVRLLDDGAGLGPGRYTLSRWELEIGDDRVARSVEGGRLVGSATGLPRAAALLRAHLRLTDPEIQRLTRTNPARILGGPTNA